jgi:anti-anti-sigma factor
MNTIDTPSRQFGFICLQDTLLIQMPPRLTVVEAMSFRQFFREQSENETCLSRIILDFGQTTLIDSSGIGALLSNLKTARVSGIQLTLWSVGPQVKLAFSLAGLEDLLNIEPQTEATPKVFTPQTPSEVSVTHPSVRSPIKRSLDIVGSLIGLGLTGVLLAPIAIAIQLDNPGPIFFGQTRCGLMGRRFRIWKFRSMVANAEALKSTIANQAEGAFFKNDNDPRITRVGRFLRKTSLDELPQFWNVLKGDMSLIGTRPPTPDEVDQYEVSNWQRLDVKPGLSGEWQVHGRSKIRNFEEVIRLDLRYQKNWSLTYDLKLILKTFIVVLKKDSGAV